MLVLNAEDVTYCNVIYQLAGQADVLPGLAYQDKLFVKGQSFGPAQGQEAIKRARQIFLDQKAQGLLLVVKDENGFTLWHQDDMVKIKDAVSAIDLEKLVAAMRNVGGVRIQDRQYHLTTYASCFVGSEAVTWLTEYLSISRSEAVQLGQRLIDDKWIHHVVDEQPFQDDYFFYRFYWDEELLGRKRETKIN
ncbi:MAG: mechanosensitive ion channel protein [Cyanothece sp. SIO1E1]|nr:mechanosensitive ion channel protein [Cyanothece sp. SIO1E1]